MSRPAVTREQLQQRHAQLLRRVGKIGGDLRSTRDRDSEERASELENDEVLEGLDEMGREEVGQIRAALERIETGLYGTCSACGRANRRRAACGGTYCYHVRALRVAVLRSSNLGHYGTCPQQGRCGRRGLGALRATLADGQIPGSRGVQLAVRGTSSTRTALPRPPAAPRSQGSSRRGPSPSVRRRRPRPMNASAPDPLRSPRRADQRQEHEGRDQVNEKAGKRREERLTMAEMRRARTYQRTDSGGCRESGTPQQQPAGWCSHDPVSMSQVWARGRQKW